MSPRRPGGPVARGRSWLAAALALVVVAMLAQAATLPHRARIAPFVILVPTLAALLVLAWREWRAAPRPPAADAPPLAAELAVAAWLAALLGMVLLLGVTLAVPLWLAAALVRRAGIRPLPAALTGLAAWVLLRWGLERGLEIYLPPGTLWRWVGW